MQYPSLPISRTYILEKTSQALVLGGLLAIGSSLLTPVMAAEIQNRASFDGANGDRPFTSLTLGTTANQCNIKYTKELFRICHDGASQALKPQDLLTGGASRADVISKAVIAAQSKYHLIAQNTQAKSRTRWENGPNSNFTNTSPGKWIENDGSGSSFTETARNSEYIEIYDASRDFYLRLKDRGFCFKNPGDPNWHCGDGGRWVPL